MEQVLEGEAIRKAMLILRVIWVVIAASLFIYVLIAHQLGDQMQQTQNPGVPLPMLRNILYGVAALTLFLTHFLRRLILGRRSGDSMTPMSGSRPEGDPRRAIGKYTVAVIISLALCESIGIYGLVLFLLGDSLRTLHIFVAISALAMLFYRPKREELVALAASM